MKVKICGIKDINTADYCEKIGVDFVGLNFIKTSKRCTTPTEAKLIRPHLKRTKVVGVFMNEDLDLVNSIARDLKLDYVQLHGDEKPLYCSKVYSPLIKSFSFTDKLESNARLMKELPSYLSHAEFFLFDRAGIRREGGSGKTFDWSALQGYAHEKPFFLAGGICLENIEKAARVSHPFCLDIASGAETNGKKDFQKIESLVQKIRTLSQIK